MHSDIEAILDYVRLCLQNEKKEKREKSKEEGGSGGGEWRGRKMERQRETLTKIWAM